MIAPVPHSRPLAWGYARVSDDTQIEINNSIPEQQTRITSYYQFKLAPEGVDWARIESDPTGVSATTRVFERRKAGKRLMEAMQPGDHLIVDKLDRLSRQPKDWYDIIDWLDKHGINLHIVNLLGTNIDMKTPMGRWLLGLFAMIAQLEAIQISERVRAHNKAFRKASRRISKYPPLGCKHVTRVVKGAGKKPLAFIEWDPVTRAIMQEVVRLADVERLSWQDIGIRIETHLAEANGRQFSRSAFYRRAWSQGRIRMAYACEKYIQDNNIRDVTELPVGYTLLAKEHYKKQGYERDADEFRKRKHNNKRS